MLLRLHIVDFAIIEEVELDLGPGLNVLTGETGAGKSIIVGATGILRGGRTSSEMVRSGRKEAVVEALFDLSDCPEVRDQVGQAGLPPDDQLLVRRVIPKSGRGRVYVNGALCTAAVLARISDQLLDIAGQHEHQMLSDSGTHRQLLDALAGADPQVGELERVFGELREVAQRLARSRMDDRQRAERVDFLRFQLGELEQGDLRAGEEQELEQERRRLARASELLEVAHQGEQELYSDEGSVAERIARVRQRLEGLVGADGTLAPLSAQLEEARLLVEDAAQSLGRYLTDVELDPTRLEQVEERLDLIYRLRRKHGAGSVVDLLAARDTMRQELQQLESLDERLDQLEGQLAAVRRQAEEAATRLSATRRAAAQRLSRGVSRELSSLRMPGARLEVALSDLAPREGDDAALCFGARRLGPTGWDRVELCIRTNVGEEARPLQRIASGGELSRIMLALRKVLGRHDPVRTSIYDEVDAGVGGAVADVVGRSLAEVSRHRQVLCVTHLPQVAAYADRHFSVGKATQGRRTVTCVERLAKRAAVEELARMLGGEQVTRAARANARQLLEAAHGWKSGAQQA
jgi:DNA repair protein RecN (Recombination protein N)